MGAHLEFKRSEWRVIGARKSCKYLVVHERYIWTYKGHFIDFYGRKTRVCRDIARVRTFKDFFKITIGLQRVIN